MSNNNKATFSNDKSGRNILSYQTSAKYYTFYRLVVTTIFYLLFTDKEIE